MAGRSPVTVGVAVLYVLSLPASVAYFWATETESADSENGDGGDDEETEGNDEDDAGGDSD
ncbi:hypothetical protein ACYJ1Y_16395 [Natrialbaceae archaeon A-gly3]